MKGKIFEETVLSQLEALYLYKRPQKGLQIVTKQKRPNKN